MKTTLLISTWNRGYLLKHNLERLSHLTLPDEVLVISDGCTDDTVNICESFKDRMPIRCIYNHQPFLAMCSVARNVGIREAIGDLIITTEPEMIFVSDVVAILKKAHEEYPTNMLNAGPVYLQGDVCGKTFDPEMVSGPESFLSRSYIVDWCAQISPSGVNWEMVGTSGKGFLMRNDYCGSFTCLYKTDWLMEVNGWDECFPYPYGADDFDLKNRLELSGYGFRMIPNCGFIHQDHPKVSVAEVEQNLQYGHKKKWPDDIVANKNHEWGKLRIR